MFKARIRAATWRNVCRLGVQLSNGAVYTTGAFLVVGLATYVAGLPLRDIIDILKP